MTARGWVGIAALGIVWGIPYAFVKIAVADLSPWDIAWRRVTIGALILVLGYIGICILARLQVVSMPLGMAGVGCVTVAMVCYAIAPLIIERHLPAVSPVECAAGCLIVSSLVLVVPAAFTLPTRLPGAPALISVMVLGAIWLLHEKLGIGNASGLGLILIGLWLTTRRTGQDSAVERRHRIEVFEA